MEGSNKERQDNLQTSVRVRGEEKKVRFSENKIARTVQSVMLVLIPSFIYEFDT